jgi:hypothetical protein
MNSTFSYSNNGSNKAFPIAREVKKVKSPLNYDIKGSQSLIGELPVHGRQTADL